MMAYITASSKFYWDGSDHMRKYALTLCCTACVFGAIPPFSFHPDLRLIADPLLFDRYPEIAFNAGQLDKSIILNTEDYLRIARPELVAFRREG